MNELTAVSGYADFRADARKDVTKNTGRSDASSANRQVAREMESLFAYQLLKVMRETTNSLSDESNGIGQDTYSSLFDMEISKLLSQRGMGLQDSIMQWLGRVPGAADVRTENKK